MMLIVSLDFYLDAYSGFYDDGKNYVGFSFMDGELKTYNSYPKEEYKSYEQFVGIMSKFDPETFFLESPVAVHDLTEEELRVAWESLPLLEGG